MKGAPEYVLQHCTKMLNSSGHEEYMNDDKRNHILSSEIILQYASKDSLRTFAYAYKDINSDDWEALQA